MALQALPVGPVETIIEARAATLRETAKSEERSLTSFLAIIIYVIKRFATNNDIAKIETKIQKFKHDSLAALDPL